MNINARTSPFGKFTLKQMRRADAEFRNFQAPDHVALGIGDGLAMFPRQGLCQFIHIPVQQAHEFHHYAGALLWVLRGPGGLCSFCILNRGIQLIRIGQGDFGLDLTGCRIKNIRGASAFPSDALPVNKMPDILHVELFLFKCC